MMKKLDYGYIFTSEKFYEVHITFLQNQTHAG